MAAPTTNRLQAVRSPWLLAVPQVPAKLSRAAWQAWLLLLVLACGMLPADAGHIFWHPGINSQQYHRKALDDSVPLRWVRVRNRGSIRPRRHVTTRDSTLVVIDEGNMLLFTSSIDCEDGDMPSGPLNCRDFYYNPQACKLDPESYDRCCVCKKLRTTAATADVNFLPAKFHAHGQVLTWHTKSARYSPFTDSTNDTSIMNTWVQMADPYDTLQDYSIKLKPGARMGSLAQGHYRGWEVNSTFLLGNGEINEFSPGAVDRQVVIGWMPPTLTRETLPTGVSWTAQWINLQKDEEIPLRRVDFAMASDDGSPVVAYIYGGLGIGNVSRNQSRKLGDFWIANSSAELGPAWVKRASCPSLSERQGEPCPRTGHTLTNRRTPMLDSKLEAASPYLFAGNVSEGETRSFSSQLWVYFRRNDSWVRLMYGGYGTEARSHHSAVISNTGNVRFYGGIYEEVGCFDEPKHDSTVLCGDDYNQVASALFSCREYGYRSVLSMERRSHTPQETCATYHYDSETWRLRINSKYVLSKVCCSIFMNSARGEVLEYNISSNTMVGVHVEAQPAAYGRPLSDDPGARAFHHAVPVPNGMLILGGEANDDLHLTDNDDSMFVLLDGWHLNTTYLKLEGGETKKFTLQPRVLPHAEVTVRITEQPLSGSPTLLIVSPTIYTLQVETAPVINISVRPKGRIYGEHSTRLIFDTTSPDTEFNGGALNMVDVTVHLAADPTAGVRSVILPGSVSGDVSYVICPMNATTDPNPPVAGGCVPCYGDSCPDCGAGMKFSYWKSYPLCTQCAPGRYRNEEHVYWASHTEKCAPCPEGSYQPHAGMSECLPCRDQDKRYKSTVCPASEDGSRPEILAQPRMWKISDDEFVECIAGGHACLGNNTCEKGSTGVMCGQCEDGWVKGRAKISCEECASPNLSAFLMIMYYLMRTLFVFYATVKAMGSAYDLKYVKDCVLRIFTNYVLIMGRSNFVDHFGSFFDPISSILRSSSGGTFFVFTMQCGYRTFSDIPQWRNYVILGWLNPLLGLLTALTYAFAGRKLQWASLSGSILDDCICMSVVYVYTIYASSLSYLLESIATYRDQRLALDQGTFAWQADQAPWTTASIFGLIVWGPLVPLAVLATLVYYKRKYGLNDQKTRVRVGFLLNGYEARCYYWEAYVVFRQFVVMAIDSWSLTFADVYCTLLMLAASVVFLVVHMSNKPYDNRFNEELDTLEMKMLCCFVASNAMDLLLQVLPSGIQVDVFKWPCFIISLYLNCGFLMRCILMLGNDFIPGSCMDYGWERWKCILISNQLTYQVRTGKLSLENLLPTERSYLAKIMKDIDAGFCVNQAALTHLRLGGVRHEVVREAARHYYRTRHVRPDKKDFDPDQKPLTAFSSKRMASSEPETESAEDKEKVSQFLAAKAADIYETTSAKLQKDMHDYSKERKLKYLRDTLEVPHHVTMPIDELHIEIMRQCAVSRFLQALCRDEDDHWRLRPPTLPERAKGAETEEFKKPTGRRLGGRSSTGSAAFGSMTGDLTAHSGDQTVATATSAASVLTATAASSSKVSYAVAPSDPGREIRLKAAKKKNELALQWFDEACFGHHGGLCITHAESLEKRKKEKHDQDGSDSESSEEHLQDNWAILDPIVFQVKKHHWEREIRGDQYDGQPVSRAPIGVHLM